MVEQGSGRLAAAAGGTNDGHRFLGIELAGVRAQLTQRYQPRPRQMTSSKFPRLPHIDDHRPLAVAGVEQFLQLDRRDIFDVAAGQGQPQRPPRVQAVGQVTHDVVVPHAGQAQDHAAVIGRVGQKQNNRHLRR